MNSKLELGRIAGVPIYLDMLFVLILVIFTYPYFTSGNTQAMSYGLLLMAGILLSVLLHELGHGAAAAVFKTRISHIELTGLGGLIYFASSLPGNGLKRAAIFLAGPAANLAIMYVCGELGQMAIAARKPLVAQFLMHLSSLNWWLVLFNLLPAFPLDGGRTLDALLGTVIGGVWAQRLVAGIGLLVSAAIGVYAAQSLPGSMFMLLVAFFMLEQNWSMFQQAGGFGGRR
jgi:Zn-dependent protease